MNDLTPALTAEEWAKWGNQGYAEMAVASAAVWMGLDNAVPLSDVNARMVAVANAALPDSHPGKITAADVEAARAMGDADMDAADSMDTSPRHAVTLWRLAAKLAALLPPHQPPGSAGPVG